MNLKKLFDMQKKLDEKILERFPHLRNEDLLPKKILALQVEIGELCNCWRGFKFWSKDQKPRTQKVVEWKPILKIETLPDGDLITKNEYEPLKVKNPLLEEYVDCLHFILSIGLEIGFVRKPMNYLCGHNLIKEFNTMFYLVSKFYEFYFRYGKGCGLYDMYEEVLGYFLGFGVALGFTLEQIEEAYMRKNAINHKRMESGY